MVGAEQVTHVPYRGGGPAINDLVAGTIDMMFDVTPQKYINRNEIRAASGSGIVTMNIDLKKVDLRRSK